MTQDTKTDCRSDVGVTVGLLDALMAISRLLPLRLKKEDLEKEIVEALLDIHCDEDLRFVMDLANQLYVKRN